MDSCLLTQRRLPMHELCHWLLPFCVSLAKADWGKLLISLPQSHVTLQQAQHGRARHGLLSAEPASCTCEVLRHGELHESL